MCFYIFHTHQLGLFEVLKIHAIYQNIKVIFYWQLSLEMVTSGVDLTQLRGEMHKDADGGVLEGDSGVGGNMRRCMGDM